MSTGKRFRALALVLGSSALGALAVACSSSTDPLFGDPPVDAASTDGTTSNDGRPNGNGGDSTTTPGDDDPHDDGGTRPADGSVRHDTGPGDGDASTDAPPSDAAPDAPTDASPDVAADAGADAAVDCGAPLRIFTNDAGPFCPFTSLGPASCAVGEHCCEYTLDSGLPSTCNAANAACQGSPGVFDWGCDELNDCPDNQVCCLVATVQQPNPSCRVYRVSGLTGSLCRPGGCNANENVLCGTQADCTSGTCTAFNVRGKNVGFCAP